jgi:hypothetical protein
MLTSPRFTKSQATDVENWIRQRFGELSPTTCAITPETLNLAFAALRAAIDNLLGSHPGRIDDFKNSAFAKLEANSPYRFALDPGTFQVICKTESASDAGLDWPRFGISRAGEEEIEAFFNPSMFDPTIDLATKAPDAALFLNTLTEQSAAVVAFLGTARVNANEGVELIPHVRDAVLALDNTAFMTGGYRGAFENSYGVTRAGFDVPKRLERPTIWVMCEAGVMDSSQTPDAKSICGKNWGDDTPAMEACSDGAIFFRNIPAGKMYGAWTFVEIANFLASAKNKPIAIVDPTVTAQSERLFGHDVPLFKTGHEAALYLRGRLDAVRKQRAHFEVAPITMRTIQRGRTEDDIQMVDIVYPDNTFHALYVPVVPSDQAQAALHGIGLEPPDEEPTQRTFMHAIWQDLLLLDAAGVIELEHGTDRSEILALPTAATVAAYTKCRQAIQDKLDADDAQFTLKTKLKRADGKEIWFLYEAQPITALLAGIGASG